MGGYLTTRQAGELAQLHEWEVRRIVDSLGHPIERFGLKRMIPRDLLPAIVAAASERRRGPQPGLSDEGRPDA